VKNTEGAFRWIVGILRTRQIPFRITGGLAAQQYGATRPLADIDIDIPSEKFEAILPAVKDYITWGPERYSDENWNLHLMTLTYEGQEIDIAGASDAKIYDVDSKSWISYPADLSQVEPYSVYGCRVPIISRRILINYKKQLGRGVDLSDVREIES
jgi:hypothetical protein